MAVSAADVKALREKTGAGFMDCKAALEEAGGDAEAAVAVLRKKGVAVASKRAGRATAEGVVASYIHAGGRIGVLVEVDCETDFVARTPDFQEFAKSVAMQVAAERPVWVSPDDVPAEALEREREILRDQALREGKPERIVEKMVEGRLNKFYEEQCLLKQPYIRDEDRKIEDLLTELIGKVGENIVVRRFARFAVGEEA